MKASGRILKYAKKNFNEVKHTTLNPEGPGVVRIHLVPPVVNGDDVGPSVAIINGQDIIPVDVSWTILLSEFITEVNKYSGRELSDEETKRIVRDTCKSLARIYPFISGNRLRSDIHTIMDTFKMIAYREEVGEEIPYMSIGEYAPYMRAPHRMDLMVSATASDDRWNCNLNCIHCYAAGQPLSGEKELTTEKWRAVIDRLRVIGVPQLTFTGGEPTMRDDLIELIEHAQWFVTRLNTNGIKLTKEYCHALKAASLDSLQITCYSSDAGVHNLLVGAEGHEATVAGIKNALELNMSVSVNTPLCTMNEDYVSTLKFLNGLGVTFVTCSGLISTGNAKKEKSENLRLSKERISEILREAVEYCFSNGMEISFTSPGWVDDALCGELGINTPICGACLSNMAITPGGSVVPCQSWLSGKPLGNILENDWESIWNGDECRMRRSHSAEMDGACPLKGDA